MRVIYAVTLTLGGLALLVLLIPAAPMTGDGQYYIQFVRNGLHHGASSWHERRLLGPLIVRALPTDAQSGFFILTSVSLAVTSLLTWLAARELLRGTHDARSSNESRALAAIPLLFGTWAVAPNLREYGLVDPLAWAFVAGIWLATLRKQWWLAALLGLVGVVAKEVVAITSVAAAAAAFDRRRPWPSIAVCAPAIVTVAALTLVFPGSGSDAFGYLTKWVRDGLFSNGVGRAAFLMFASYSALWLLLPRAWARLPDHLKRAALVYLAAAILLPLVGSPERMEEAIFPLIVSSALLATWEWQPALVWALGISVDVFAARVGGDARLPTIVAWAGLAVALALTVWTYVPLRLLPAPTRGLRETTVRSR